MKYSTIEEAVQIQNSVPQGLSSSIMTLNMREAGIFFIAGWK
jgi:aldehyde dehydrogenase (NAD+)